MILIDAINKFTNSLLMFYPYSLPHYIWITNYERLSKFTVGITNTFIIKNKVFFSLDWLF